MKMKIKLLNNDAVIPKRGTEDSAGYDIYSTDAVFLHDPGFQ